MGLIRNILFPVDFSPSSVAMAPYVKRAADIFGARVTLLHVFNPITLSGVELLVRTPDEVAEEHLEVARQKLDHFLQAEFPAPENRRILADGDPATQIAQTASDGFDAIFIPSHAGNFRRMLLGSTAAKVLDAADCPVATSAHSETIAPRPLEHREWLCAIGVGEDSERVLRFAHQVTSEAHVNLRIIHAVPSTDPALPIQLDLEDQIQSEERRLVRERIEDLQRKVGSRASLRIAVGPIKDALLEAARQSDADALLIGRSPQPGSQGRLRDLTYAVVRDSPIPVMSV